MGNANDQLPNYNNQRELLFLSPGIFTRFTFRICLGGARLAYCRLSPFAAFLCFTAVFFLDSTDTIDKNIKNHLRHFFRTHRVLRIIGID